MCFNLWTVLRPVGDVAKEGAFRTKRTRYSEGISAWMRRMAEREGIRAPVHNLHLAVCTTSAIPVPTPLRKGNAAVPVLGTATRGSGQVSSCSNLRLGTVLPQRTVSSWVGSHYASHGAASDLRCAADDRMNHSDILYVSSGVTSSGCLFCNIPTERIATSL